MKQIIAFLLFFCAAICHSQVRVGKAVLDYQIERYDTKLKINGAGVRSMLFIDLYSIGLYLEEKSNDALSICFEDKTMSLLIKITSKIVDRDKFVEAVNEGFEKATDHNPGPIADKIKYVKDIFSDPIVKDDFIELLYEKGFGVHFYKNNKKIGEIKGQDFKFSFYKIWLGKEPVNEKLKNQLLGNY